MDRKKVFRVIPEAGGEPLLFNPAQWDVVHEKVTCDDPFDLPGWAEEVTILRQGHRWLRVKQVFYPAADREDPPVFAALSPSEAADEILSLGGELPQVLVDTLAGRFLDGQNLDEIVGHEPPSGGEANSIDDYWPSNYRTAGIDALVPPHPREAKAREEKGEYPHNGDLERDRFIFWKRQMSEELNWKQAEIVEAAQKRNWTIGKESSTDRCRTFRRYAQRYGDWVGLAMKSLR